MAIHKIVGAAYDEKAALDLATAFLKSGLTVDVYSGDTYCASSITQASVYNLNSFFMTPEDEYCSICRLFSSVPDHTISFLKTDSSLRGNIGAELRGLLDVGRERRLPFVPALPSAKKFTRNGVQYQLVEKERIVLANAAEKITSFRGTEVVCGSLALLNGDGIQINDCESVEDMEELVEQLKRMQPRFLAGSGALAGELRKIYDLPASASLSKDSKMGVLLMDTLEWKEM